MHDFYFHEDEPGQIQVLPIEWRGYCEKSFNDLKAHDEAHFDPASTSWDEMYTFPEPDPDLPGIRMSEARFVELLKPHARQFDQLDNPLAEWDKVRAIGFGPDGGNTGIIADLDDNSVGTLWCRTYSSNQKDQEVLANLFCALTTDQHLLLVGWANHTLVDLRNRADVEEYLQDN